MTNPRTNWVGRTEECDEHLVVNDVGHAVRVRPVGRRVEKRKQRCRRCRVDGNSLASESSDASDDMSESNGNRQLDAERDAKLDDTRIIWSLGRAGE